LGKSPVACLAERYVAHGGDSNTVNVGGFDDKSFVQGHGPSYREIIDWSDVDKNSLFLNPLGQSGNIFSKNYGNIS
jgi:penicillin amidase